MNVCEAYSFLAFYICWWIRESHWESASALQYKLGKRERVFENHVFIENTCLGIGSEKKKKCRTKFKRGRSFTQVTWFSWPMVPETDYLCASAIFVVVTSRIPPNLNYRSVKSYSLKRRSLPTANTCHAWLISSLDA